MDNVLKKIDRVSFVLKNDHDFDWLRKYGKVFCVFDQQDSGNICFGVENHNKKLFIKYAGASTVNYDGKNEDAVLRMKNATPIYENIHHPNLIKLIEHFKQGEGYASIYEWVDGQCLHAHWNFHKYPKYTHAKSPNYKFNLLDLDQKLDCIDRIFSLHKLVAEKSYVAVDFYDGSIIYDFTTHKTTICDMNFYTEGSFINTMGRMWGSSRFMSPEEFELGATIDEITNVFTMGALAFECLTSNGNRNILQWQASEELFKVAEKATHKDKSQRYQSINKLYLAWQEALAN